MNDKKSDVNWVLYELSSDKRVEFYKKGKAGLEEFKENLDDSKILLGGFRVTGVDKKSTVVSIRSKFVFVTWVGSKVASKSGLGTVMSSIRTFFAGYNIFVDVRGVRALVFEFSSLVFEFSSQSSALLVSRLRHRPTRHSNSNAQIHTQIVRKLISRFALEHRYWTEM